MRFIKLNKNPNTNKSGDCVIRALATAFDKNWFKVYEELYLISVKQARILTDTEVIQDYLQDYEETVHPAVKGKKRMKVQDLKDDGVYVVRIANHLTTVMDNRLVDTFDCRTSTVYRSWKVKG